MLLNVVHRHVRKNMNQTSDSTVPTMSKGVFQPHTSTGRITCHQAFYMGGEKQFFPFISPTKYALFSQKERLMASYNQRRVLCLDATKFVSLSANSLIEAICLKIWQNYGPKIKRPLPADVLRSKSPQLARVPIVASQSLLNVPFSHVLDQE